MALSEFYWGQQLSGVAEQQQATAGRTYYEGFTLNGVDYAVGDCVLLYPESDGEHYIGRINSTFCLAEPSAVGASDPHCIEVNWFERRTNLEPDFRGCPEKEREVVELEETDINPIGCISGKCVLLRALKYEDAAKQAKGLKSCWFFCRGVFKQHLNCFVVYRELAALEEQAESKKPGKRAQQQTAPEHVADSEEVLAAAKRPRPNDPTATQKDGEQWEHPAQQAHHSHGQHAEHDSSEEATTAIGRHHSATTAARPLKVVATGRVCVECGATQTPQWREGPQGPKTLCNACGVRYVRAQQRANKRAVGAVSTTRPAPAGQAARKPVPVSSNAAGSKPKAKLETAASTATGAVAASARARITSLPEEPASRPMRQAALLAANKTAQFARTGVFPVSEDELKQHTTSQPAPVQQQQQQVQQVAGPSSQLQHMLPAKPALPPTSTPESNDDSNNSSAEDYMFDTADKLLMQQAWPEERGLGCDDGSGDDLLGLSGADSAMPIAFVATDDEDAMRSVASMDDAVQSTLGPSAASKMIMQQGHLGHDSLFESFEALSSHDHLLVPLDGGADTKARGASSSAAAGTASKAFPSCMNEFASHFSSSPMHMDCDASLIHMSGSHHHALMDVSNAGGLLAADGSELVTVHT